MADFDPPFADDGMRRAPLPTEQQLGWPCGPASRELFNYLFWLHQGQIKNIADEAGVASEQTGDHTVLKRAVIELINAAIAQLDPPEDPDLSAFVTINQARSRLPIFPDVLHSDGHLGTFSPATGVVRVPAGRDFLHRGIFIVTTSEVNLNTDASKTYHLRWNRNDGFVLRDLASGTYNPGTLPEAHPSFDSTYDDMLVARVIANSSNVVTVTNLLNKPDLFSVIDVNGVNLANSGANNALFRFQVDYNWARTPKVVPTLLTKFRSGSWPNDSDWRYYPEGSNVGTAESLSRYRFTTDWIVDGAQSLMARIMARAAG